MAKAALFVPGFLGSNLHLGDPLLGQANKIWLGVPTFLGGGYKLLDLDGHFPIPGNIPLEIGETVTYVYGDFYQWLSTRFEVVDTIPWDWRTGADLAAPGVAQVLRDEFAMGHKVTLIGHSMGGIVAAMAANLLTPEEKGNLSWIVTIGTPWRGSWRAIEALLGRAESVRQGSDLAAIGLFSIPRWERFKIQQVISSFQGLYQLFPNDEIQAELSPPGVPNVWNPVDIVDVFTPCNVAKLAQGRTFANANHRPDPSIPHINVYGVGSRCPGPFTPADHFNDSNLDYALTGDGVVPIQSARFTAPSRELNLEVNGDHGRLCSALGTTGALAALI